MYKKALLVLVAGVAVFYGIAIARMALAPKSVAGTPIVTTYQPPDPAPLIEPSIITPPVDPNANTTLRPRIDVVFAIDSTGSMGDEIEVVKANIRDIISEISQAQPAPDVRYGIVTYRDRGDQYVTKSWQFTRDVQAISRTLSNIVADGGGDKPEAVSEALHVSLHKMTWDVQAKSKIIFLIGDAGPNNYSNDYRWQDEINYAAQQNIRINTIACSGIEAEEERIFAAIANPTNGMYAHLTYKQEVARADGSRAVVIEEAGRTYEVSKDAADKDWSRGADELIARNEAKEINSSPADVSISSLSMGTMGAKRDMAIDSEREADVKGGVEGGVVGGAMGYSTSEMIASRPTAPPPMPAAEPSRSMDDYRARESKVSAAPKAKPATRDYYADSAGTMSERSYAGAQVLNKTNNLNTLLADSIKKEARKQGATYGSVLVTAFDFKGTASGVKTAKQLVIDSRDQMQAVLGSATGIDISRIDFNSQFVVALYLGQIASNTTVTINSVSLSGNDLIVNYSQVNNGAGSTTPFHLIVLPRQQVSGKVDAKNLFVKFEKN